MYLNAHTYYSLRYGTLSPKQLVQAAKKSGVKALALTDINNTSCSFEFIKQCKKEGIKPLLGIEFRQDNRHLFTGIARNNEGFFELNKLLTECSVKGIPLPEIAPPMQHIYIIYTDLVKPIEQFRSNEFIGIRPDMVNGLYSSPLQAYQDKLLMFCSLTFLNNDGYRIHKLLRAIDLNTVLSKLRKEDFARKDEIPFGEEQLRGFYERYPRIIQNTERLIETCKIDLVSSPRNNRQHYTQSRKNDFGLLRKLALSGCKQRYGKDREKAIARIEKELEVIGQLNFASYFLITKSIVDYARSLGHHYIGRGSGANSIVAFCLRITDVDPLELNLYFERFINLQRSSPPDFDIDFSWDERDDVIDYIFEHFGAEYTALLATYNTFKGKSIIRELAKVHGLPKAEIDLLINEPRATARHHALGPHIFKLAKMMEGFPNYLSIHAGGIIISERPINYFTALKKMPKGFAVTHFDMYGAEDLGFHKYDILSQRGLGHIRDTVKLVLKNQNRAIDIHNVVRIKNDRKTRAQLRSGHCIGCFYIESPAMRGLITKLRCSNYIELVAASSIIRPGVSQSGMMRQYIQRFHNPDSFEYLHPIFKEHLAETFGVMVYQEDVMKVCHHFAGFSLGESDVLRRIMSGKRCSSDRFEELRQKFFSNCKERGHPDKLTAEVWRQIESFGGYSFCKAHSASYAVESFQSLYLKAHYPLEFMVAVINNFGGFYRSQYYLQEARMQGASIHAPCVNKSYWLSCIYRKDIYLGFVHLQQMEQKTIRTIVGQREKNGPYQDLEDFLNRVDIGSEQLDILIRIGGFRFTNISKYELMWKKNALYRPRQKLNRTGLLFKDRQEPYELPELKEGPFDQAFDEIELLGFPLCSPFQLLTGDIHIGILAKQFLENAYRVVTILGYYVTRKQLRTKKGASMAFGTWLDREGHFFDTTHFSKALKRSPFRGRGCYRIRGKVTLDSGFFSITVTVMEKLPFVKDGRY